MTQSYTGERRFGRTTTGWLLVLLGLLLGTGARAQSGPYGNEWIVAGQPYYKVKVWRDGLYRLDYNYLRSLSATGVAPTQFQLWRRGKEVAVYQGGNAATLDATSYLEFYGQRNDGVLDREYYKNPAEQAHQYYSLYTDTAAYFITWGSRAGKRMAQPVAAGGTPHATRMQTVVKVAKDKYYEAPAEGTVHMPWLNSGEGFFSEWSFQGELPLVSDSLLRAVVTTAGARPIRAEVCAAGRSDVSGPGGPVGQHTTSIRVMPPGASAARELGQLVYQNYNFKKGIYTLNPSDIGADGKVEIRGSVVGQRTGPVFDVFVLSYFKLTAPQQSVWFSDRRNLWFQNDSLLSGPATYELANVPASVVGYDIHDPYNVQRIAATATQTPGSTARRFVFPDATSSQTRRLFLADAAAWLAPSAPVRVNFRTINAATPNFVIITHPKLMKAAGTVPNAALEYAKYRASAAGGRFDTLMVTAPQLYDQFHYGERSVLALRHFALWAAATSPATQTKYLLLLGKGLSAGVTPGMVDLSTYFGVNASGTTRVLGEQGLDLVPTSTSSTSDIFLSADWPNNNLVARLPTGRVPAATPQEVVDYLNKLREHEDKLTTYSATATQDWRKNVLHLVGGLNVNEFAQFGAYVDGHAQRVRRPYLGGTVTTLRKTAPGLPVTVNIANELNTGLSVIQYFGHGSPTRFNLEIGDINDPATNYRNAGRYPVMMYNGCAAGDCFFQAPTFGPSWLLSPQKGSVGMLAQACESYAHILDPTQDLVYKLLFNDPDWYGQPVTRVFGEAVRRLQLTPLYQNNVAAATEQFLATTWQGDPALRLYAPAKPDFIASNATLSVAPAPGASVISATAPFVLRVGVSNPARITTDSIEIRVTRTYAGGSRPADVLTRTFRQAWVRDTTYTITLNNTGNVYGYNTFRVELDYRNKVSELDETNNVATTNYSFLQGSLTLLTPTEFAIVNTNRPRLTAQNNDPAAAVRGYDFQVDTVATFNSPKLQQSLITGPPTVSWQPAALVGARPDSVVWYWRVRLSAPTAQEDPNWQLGSFRVISTVPSGWSQSHYAQLKRDQLQQVAVAAPSGRWSFTDQRLPIGLTTAGGGGVGAASTFSTGYGIRTDLTSPPSVASCGIGSPNLLLAVLDGRTLQRITVAGGPYNTCGSPAQSFYHFGSTAGDTLDNLNNSAARQQQLVAFLQNVPDGAYVALISMNRLRYAAFPASLRTALTTMLGSQLAAAGQLRNGDPWVLLAKKQAAGGLLVREQGPDRSLAQASYSQLVSIVDTARAPGQAGKVLSARIGPAKEWQSLFNVIKRENTTGKYTLRVLGLDANNAATVLYPNVTAKTLNLNNVPVATYPYLQLELVLSDSVNRVPPQLKQWLVTYKALPEGTVRRDLVAAADYDPATLAAQAATTGSISFPVKFENIGGLDFAAPLTTRIDLLNTSGVSVANNTFVAPRILKADSVMTVPVKLNVIGKFGTLTPVVTVNPLQSRQPELYFFNNTLTLAPFSVLDKNVPPTLDVAFDGRHLLNGDIVSPTPAINIQLKDEDNLRRLKEASAFTVLLQKPGAPTSTLISTLNNPEIQFSVDSTSQAGSVARLEYHPGKTTPLADGTYTLQVQGRDRAGSAAGTQNYQVKFEVISQSTITNVFPYPNPVTSKARFVFTVTGQELPRDMKIQIMTLTGKVVREIFMSELGPLHIGNNITDYAWDGTDQYGDRLANGTYLYRVSLNDPSGQFSKRNTAGDQGFQKDWGKLVLLR
ncbi:MAG TPA: C25 family cysteine peptidase [Hymenobacter sp.]|uniref:putative type IX secretion system sortase PorU2 n=1 Tax=Hymenobacter sp. TaxID=1898978 RepID=UPI002D807114|nr:C25 family cysteine peptidase [Hymenobacter sp.]HET9502762.1 C25 family cysteine peptidase [Hymenobacter sp.]